MEESNKVQIGLGRQAAPGRTGKTRKCNRAFLHGSESSGGRGIFVGRTASDSCAGNGGNVLALGVLFLTGTTGTIAQTDSSTGASRI